MSFSVDSSISALTAFGTQMGVTANNVANVESEAFKKSRALLQEGSHGRVEVNITRIDTPGPTRTETIDGQEVQREMSNVDLAEEIPGTIATERGFEANLTVIRTRDEMMGSILDILG